MTIGFRSRLTASQPLFADGAWGSMLVARGLPRGDAPESWTIERPDVLCEIATDYLAAGARILTTNTLGATPLRLAPGLARRATELNTRAVELVRRVAAGRAWVAGSVGPTGRLLAPFGDLQPDAAYAAFAAQVTALARAGADLIAIETMVDLTEATMAVRAARTVARLPIVATMTFDVTARGVCTAMGVSVEQAARALEAAGADVVGASCGNGAAAMLPVAREFVAHARVPIAIRPNAGAPLHGHDVAGYVEEPEEFAAAAAGLRLPGIAILGGCCGTTPAHIRLLAEQGSRNPRTMSGRA
jgi:5-methyltetrahydrofolate--homocysteine methyltransferase